MATLVFQRGHLWWLAIPLLLITLGRFLDENVYYFNNEMSFVCEQPQWKVRIVSYDPFIAHIENFLAASERRHLLRIQEGNYFRSAIASGNQTAFRSQHRTSSSGLLPREDPTVRCILQRAAEIQGFVPLTRFENPEITYYRKGQEFQNHFDWKADDEGMVINRESTIFAILDCSCTNCGTTFPDLEVDWTSQSSQWCRFFECKNDTLTTRPVLGSALYWRNVHSDGSGDRRTLHAGLPIPEGFKAGLNIWTSVETHTL